MTVSRVTRSILGSIRPESPSPKIKQMLEKVNSQIKKHNIKATAEIGGSLAKGTNLARDYDVDIFIKFDLSYEDQDLSKLLAKILKPIKPTLVHGSRDYFQKQAGKINFEFIPVLFIQGANQALNITDCSPLHTTWFVKKGKKVRDDVRLAKMFCKAAGVYGAESYIRGFSGHTMDILVVHYGGFEQLLKASLKWKEKIVVDPERAHNGNALKILNRSKIEGPLIVIDPVDPYRNAASNVGREKFHKFIEHSRRFLNNPSEEFFEIKKLDVNQLKKKFPVFLEVKVITKKAKVDVAGSRILKVFETLQEELEEYSIIESGWYFDKESKGMLWFGVSHDKRKSEVTISGPPLSAKKHVANFKKKHKKTFTKSGRIYTTQRRRLLSIDKVALQILKKPYLKQRMKSCSVKLH